MTTETFTWTDWTGRERTGRRWSCSCGRKVEATTGDTSCDGCGKEFNAFGQELKPGWSWDEERNEANEYQEA